MGKKSYLHQRGLSRGYLTLREAARYHDVPVSKIVTAVTHNCSRHKLLAASSGTKINFNQNFVEWNPW
jgi:hypothetical protein